MKHPVRVFPIARDGWRFIIPLAVISGGLFMLPGWLGTASGSMALVLLLFCLYFFRDLPRAIHRDESLIYSPGDGRVLEVCEGSGDSRKGWKSVRIFLSVFDGHLQRAPVSGCVEKVDYKKGNFFDARDPRAHLNNERNAVTLSTPKGTVVVTQVAGLIARRIVCWVKEGADLSQGEPYGLIRFGSQVDVLIPSETEVLIRKGDRVVGGKSVIARW